MIDTRTTYATPGHGIVPLGVQKLHTFQTFGFNQQTLDHGLGVDGQRSILRTGSRRLRRPVSQEDRRSREVRTYHNTSVAFGRIVTLCLHEAKARILRPKRMREARVKRCFSAAVLRCFRRGRLKVNQQTTRRQGEYIAYTTFGEVKSLRIHGFETSSFGNGDHAGRVKWR